MKKIQRAVIFAAITGLLFSFQAQASPGPLKVAFIGDQGVSTRAEKVLKLVKKEGAKLVVHAGDFGYRKNPAEFERQINRTLGSNFPVIPTVGNHDVEYWDAPGGYRDLFERRLLRAGVEWDGTLGERARVTYRNLSVFIASPGIFKDARKGTDGYAAYLGERLAKDDSQWKICLWHKNQERMNVGDKYDETGWAVYETCRKAGAIIFTGHSHIYSRTHLLSDMEKQTVASTSSDMAIGNGKTIAIVNGLGGNHRDSIKKERVGAWWAVNYADEYGALFCDFNPQGAPVTADCYFKDAKRRVIDRFTLRSAVQQIK